MTATATATATTSTTAAEGVWLPPDNQGQGSAPEFPSVLEGWRLQDSWNSMPRAFIGRTWTPVSGPNYGTFPATMNGCNTQLFLVRWRALAPGAPVEARWTYGPQQGKSLTSDAGWMSRPGESGDSLPWENLNYGTTG